MSMPTTIPSGLPAIDELERFWGKRRRSIGVIGLHVMLADNGGIVARLAKQLRKPWQVTGYRLM
jgi:hypothetical protein